MNFIEIYDNALSAEDCKFTIGYMNGDDIVRYPNGTSNIISRGVYGNNSIDISVKDSFDRRMVFCYNPEPYYSNAANKVNDIVYDALGKCINDYKGKYPELEEVPRWELDENYNIQKYNKGGGYFALHCENDGGSNERMMAWMVYLNTVTDGGGTYFSNYDLTINAVEGRMVIWPAYWTHHHKGIVSHTQEKYISTGWFCFQNK